MWVTNLLLVFLMNSHCDGLVRDKRIIFGGYVSEQDPKNYYSAIKYYAWISNGHECDINIGLSSHWEIPVPSFLGLHCSPDPWHLTCGGAVITGDLIATACHCLASFDAPKGSYSRMQARVYNHWERFSTVFIGGINTHSYHYGMRSKGFIIHKKCAVLSFADGIETSATHDFGWIYLEKSLIFSPDAWLKRGLVLGYAPTYTDDELARMFYKVVGKQLVCLYIGYGKYEFLPKSDIENNENSPGMKYGFNVMMDYKTCRDVTDVHIPPSEEQIFKYEDDASWTCGERFGLKSPNKDLTTALFGHGDSGGPVTCDNRLFGVVSQAKISFFGEKILGAWVITSCNVFAVWEYAINYRASFLKVVKGRQDIPNVLPTFKFKPIPYRRSFEFQLTKNPSASSLPSVSFLPLVCSHFTMVLYLHTNPLLS